MEQKTIILCPNPDRDRGMKATTTAIQLLQSVGFKTVVCSPFRDPKAGAFGNLPVKPILPELKTASLIITLGGDGTILHLAKLAALHQAARCWESTWADWASLRSLRSMRWRL